MTKGRKIKYLEKLLDMANDIIIELLAENMALHIKLDDLTNNDEEAENETANDKKVEL